MALPNPGDNAQAGSPWIDPSASQNTLAVLSAADAIQSNNPGSLFYAFHGTGRVFLVADPGVLKFAHGYPSIEEAVGNSNSTGGLFGGGQDLAYLNSAGGKTGTAATTGANSEVIAWFNVVTRNDQASQGKSPTGPDRRVILSASVGNSNVNGMGDSGLGNSNDPQLNGTGGSPDSTGAGKAIASATNPLGWLTGNGSNLVYRGVAIVGGLALLYLGLNRMTGGKIQQAVTGTTKAATKVIP